MLLQTKFFKPVLRPALISRPHLIAWLNAGLGTGSPGFLARLTLVSAPAGFGKTTLVTSWLDQLANHSAQNNKILTAWLSLDENDNDPVRFLTYLIVALQTAIPDTGQTALSFLKSPQSSALETVLTLLLNDISQHGRPVVLVLDDYHTINTPDIHQAVTFLLEHIPPSMHLLITTRSDPPLPMSRLRASGHLVELRAADLRFSLDETGRFFHQVMGITLSSEETAALEQRTEGWVAGMQLAALSMHGQENVSQFINDFAVSHRFILDYLTDEVLAQRPKGTRNFLLQTSILKRLCGPLCDRVTGRDNSQSILEQLEQVNLFLIPLDGERRWFRYHHLFADVLRQRLQHEQPHDLNDLHRRAQVWMEQNGLVDEAVAHAFAGGDFEQAARLIEKVYGAKWQTGEIKSLQNWLAALPEASWRTHPRLWLVQAWADMTVGNFVAADAQLKGAEAALDALDGDQANLLRPELLAFRASYASLVQDPNAVELAEQALQTLPGDYWMRGMLGVFLGAAYYTLGDLETALEVLLAQAPDPQLSTIGDQPHQIHLLAFSGMIYHAMGNLRQAREKVYQALELAEPGGMPILYVGTLLAYMAASLVLYELNELDEVEAILSRCVDQAEQFGSAEVQVFALSGLSRLYLARNDLSQAARYTVQVDALLEEKTFTPSIIAYVEYHRFLLQMKQNNYVAAADWVEVQDDRPGPLNAYAFHRVALPQFLLAQRRYEAALDTLSTLIQESRKSGHGALLIKALVLQALVFQAMGHSVKALGTIGEAIELAEPENFIRAFTDEGESLCKLLEEYLVHITMRPETWSDTLRPRLMTFTRKLLATFSSVADFSTMQPMPLIDPLSSREQEVLHLIAEGASNRDIADRLVIAVPTVKKHVSNIMSKLNASSRTQAVAEARTLDLL